MINRFTKKAQLVLGESKKIANELGHSYIGTEHLLLGILSTDCVGCKILNEKKVYYQDVLSKLTKSSMQEYEKTLVDDLTPKCKRVIEGASIVAKRFGGKFIGSEHLLLSFLILVIKRVIINITYRFSYCRCTLRKPSE